MKELEAFMKVNSAQTGHSHVKQRHVICLDSARIQFQISCNKSSIIFIYILQWRVGNSPLVEVSTQVVFRICGYGMITHNDDGVNRKACWKYILNKLNLQQSLPFPAAFPSLQQIWKQSAGCHSCHKYFFSFLFLFLKERRGRLNPERGVTSTLPPLMNLYRQA